LTIFVLCKTDFLAVQIYRYFTAVEKQSDVGYNTATWLFMLLPLSVPLLDVLFCRFSILIQCTDLQTFVAEYFNKLCHL